jgi:HSP20 family protein
MAMLPARQKRDAPLARMDDVFDRLFNDWMLTDWFPRRLIKWETMPDVEWAPSLDIVDKKDHLLVRAEVPGVKKEDLEVSVDGNILSIKGEVKREETSKDETYYYCERCSGSFGRSVRLPFEVDPKKVDANLNEGILEIKLPRVEPEKPKSIEIKVK